MPVDDRGKRLPPNTHLNSATSKFVPPAPEAKNTLAERKRKFESINQEIRRAGGWVTSVCGDRFIDFEVLPGNPLPAQIRFQVEPNGYGERILPHSVVEYFTKNADGTLSLLTEGSTRPVSSRVTQAGIARVAKFFFLID